VNEDELPDVDWFLLQIEKAQSRERLDHIATMIDYGKWEEEEWTRDEDAMNRLRDAWKRKVIEL
jgi:hypothetical protein